MMELAAPGRCVGGQGRRFGGCERNWIPSIKLKAQERQEGGEGRAQLRDRTQDLQGKDQRTGCCLLLREETTRCFHLLQKSRVSLVYNVSCNPGGRGREYVVCLWSRQLQTALFTAAPPKVSSTQLLGAGVPLGKRDHAKRNDGTGGKIKTNEFQHVVTKAAFQPSLNWGWWLVMVVGEVHRR